jgi:hypothetical protein
LALAAVNATHPQPAWQSAGVFARHYHPIQLLPYLGGVVLVSALVLLIASLHALAPVERTALTGAALVFTAAYVALIFFNYVVQTTFIPELAKEASAGSAAIVAALSMANPRSLAWGIEMWGWGFLGVATWLVAPVFQGSRLERATAATFVANGPVSIIGALCTVAFPGWVTTPTGYIAFGSWNVLLAAMAVLALLSLRARFASALS